MSRGHEAEKRPTGFVNGERVGPRLTPATIARPLNTVENAAVVAARGGPYDPAHDPCPVCACCPR